MLYKLGWINQLKKGEDIPTISYWDIDFTNKQIAIKKAHKLSGINKKRIGNPHIRIESWTLAENDYGEMELDELIEVTDIN